MSLFATIRESSSSRIRFRCDVCGKNDGIAESDQRLRWLFRRLTVKLKSKNAPPPSAINFRVLPSRETPEGPAPVQISHFVPFMNFPTI